MKNVQISKELFVKLIKYHHFEMYGFEDEIKTELEKKIKFNGNARALYRI